MIFGMISGTGMCGNVTGSFNPQVLPCGGELHFPKKKAPASPQRRPRTSEREESAPGTAAAEIPLSLLEERYADFSVFFSLPAYFLLNLSTRPAVSMIFCFPVMKGWHWEQISVLMFCRVDFVWITFPQTQVMVVSLYSG
jgi:hypothetical protein